jgi:hypothetical protein
MSEADPPHRSGVGYRQPPVEHRFKKGVSGNPQGRPKRKQAAKSTDPLKISRQPANQLLMDEAYRTVTLREGDQIIKLPAIQAVFRAMGVSAMKGNRYAQRTLAELVQQVENADREAKAEYLNTMMGYKCDGERAIEDAKARGITLPEPVPHPDDIIIDFASSSATVNGPMTKEDKADWDRMLVHRDELQLSISETASAYARARNPKRKEEWLDQWKREQRFYDRLNDNLPKRYRKDLEDRCWYPDASMPGSQRKQTWPGE